ncbi:MAG: helix-turn-helix domain-containing protein [Candidatus Dojkabacteria bacterium]|nr:helix-turn-helix domain-containing protein [Candidatus Dojkabacteria bacterium]
MEVLGNRIKLVRKQYNLTQEEFSQRIGISRNRLSEIEKGENPNDSVLIAISNVFNINLNWLKTGFGEMYDKENIDKLLNTFDNYTVAVLKMMQEMSEEEKKDFCEWVKKEKQFFEMKRELEELKRMKTG